MIGIYGCLAYLTNCSRVEFKNATLLFSAFDARKLHI